MGWNTHEQQSTSEYLWALVAQEVRAAFVGTSFGHDENRGLSQDGSSLNREDGI